jgi:hypothetical protein
LFFIFCFIFCAIFKDKKDKETKPANFSFDLFMVTRLVHYTAFPRNSPFAMKRETGFRELRRLRPKWHLSRKHPFAENVQSFFLRSRNVQFLLLSRRALSFREFLNRRVVFLFGKAAVFLFFWPGNER